MCGFIGLFERQKKHTLSEAISQLSNRGPDEQIFLEKMVSKGFLSVGFTRLAIVNRDEPLRIDFQDRIILFNGEIWNYRELAKNLPINGEISELYVINELYKQVGYHCFSQLDGDFAIAIIDLREQKIVLARDPVGVKPLFYSEFEGRFCFASDVKSIVQSNCISSPQVNYSFLLNHFVFDYSCDEDGFLEGVFPLPPGMILNYDLQKGELAKIPYRSLVANDKPLIYCSATLEKALSNAIKKRYEHSECFPQGLLLSGGFDSSLIALLSKKLGLKSIICFFIGGENEPDYPWAKMVAELAGFPFVNLTFTAEEVISEGGNIALQHPGALCGVHIYMAFKKIKELYPEIKVVMCGEGSDELFGGYPIYSDPLKYLGELKQKIILSTSRTQMASRFLEQIESLKTPMEGCRFLLDFFRREQLIENHLIPMDHFSMAHGIELRVPYLDLEIFGKVCNHTLAELTLAGKRKEWIKTLLEENGLNDRAFFTRKKTGFPHLVKDYAPKVEKLLSQHAKPSEDKRFWMLQPLPKYWVGFSEKIYCHLRAKVDDHSLVPLLETSSIQISPSSGLHTKDIKESLKRYFPHSNRIFSIEFSEMIDQFEPEYTDPEHLMKSFLEDCAQKGYSSDELAGELLQFDFYLTLVVKFSRLLISDPKVQFKLFHFDFLNMDRQSNTPPNRKVLYLAFNSGAKLEKNRILSLSEPVYNLFKKGLNKSIEDANFFEKLKQLELVT